jgi:two-component system chemotaxis response regulator CheY
MRGLIVDDSVTARLMLSFVFGDLGWEVLEAPDGRTALELLSSTPAVDLMTLDWNMPGMSGGDVLEALRKEAAIRPGKVMIVTSETELKMVNRAIGQGGDEYLMKPYTADSVLEKLVLMSLGRVGTGHPGRG